MNSEALMAQYGARLVLLEAAKRHPAERAAAGIDIWRTGTYAPAHPALVAAFLASREQQNEER
jgi:hypothetical protein